ncbi:MAG: acyl-CoA thioesterase [Calditerrivibrio sp.]|nr:acyl-CoA thioesterase [Calditerrivibrio sp.]
MTQYQYTGKIEVRYSDLDAYGHVNHATYFTYLETVRTNIFINEFEELLKNDIHLIIVSASCDYKKPIHLGNDVFVSFWTKEIKKTSFTLQYHIHDGKGVSYASAETTLVAFDNKKKKPTLLPSIITNKIIT